LHPAVNYEGLAFFVLYRQAENGFFVKAEQALEPVCEKPLNTGVYCPTCTLKIMAAF